MEDNSSRKRRSEEIEDNEAKESMACPDGHEEEEDDDSDSPIRGQDKDNNNNNNNDKNNVDEYYNHDEEGLYDDNDEPDAEGDEPQPSEEIEPSEENFGKIPFHFICKGLEEVSKRRRKPIPVLKKLVNLLPPKMIQAGKKNVDPGKDRPQSVFPLVRLLCPEKDASREYFIKHKTLAKAYIRAHAWHNTNPLAQALLNYYDPNKLAAARIGTAPGDLTEVIRNVLEGRLDSTKSSLTLTQINQALDELASFQHRGNLRPTNHDWETSSTSASSPKRRKTTNEADSSLATLQADWIRRLLQGGDRRLSPLEHKWLARMILKEMKLSIGFDKILYWFDPIAPSLWSGHNSLRGLCKIICQPSFHGKAIRAGGEEDNNDDNDADAVGEKVQTLAPYLTKSSAQIKIGVPFTPMFAHRTGFDRMLFDLSHKHRIYQEDPVFGKLQERTSIKTTSSLVLRHPAFTVETKLDGERMLLHYSCRDGLVKIHTRQSNWYSDVYSPVLGPAIRQAVGHHKLDLIIDGEVLAWDDEKEETIPFGNNKTVARFRADWMKYQGTLDTRDRDLHKGEKDTKVIHSNMLWANEEGTVPDLNGRDCWLQFIAFDIVYIDGNGAKQILDETLSPYLQVQPGSLMDLELIERKKLLYRIIKPIPRFVEIVPTLVVACDGKTYTGSSYFSFDSPPCFRGRPLHSLESAAAFLHEMSDNSTFFRRKELEEERRGESSDKDISQRRSLAVGEHYKRTVDDQRQEGLVFKDLSTPYVLDKVSRSLGYWRKFKPDYYGGSTASDVDVVIIGAYFATGLRLAGRPSSFLCACTNDMDEEEKYMPLCKVNAGSIPIKESKEILDRTGYKPARDGYPLDTGKWFTYDESRKTCPDFVSSFSFINECATMEGWKAKKEDYPDIWIDPADSIVLTINAGEIVPSTAFPSRITLRFPRITALRPDKRAREVESLQSLWDIHEEVLNNRVTDTSEKGFEVRSESASDEQALMTRFWTEEKYTSDGKGKKKLQKRTFHQVSKAPEPSKVLSNSLRGFCLVPLEGNYRLLDDSLESAEGKEEGWLEEAKEIKNHTDFEAFVKSHSGMTFLQPTAKAIEDKMLIVGGCKSDPRVLNFIGLIEAAKTNMFELLSKKKLTQKDKDSLIYAQCRGVVRWTFLLSAIARCRSEKGLTNSSSILDVAPQYLVPDALDYLARPKTRSHSFIEEMSRIDICGITKMRRLLYEVGHEEGRDSEKTTVDDTVESWHEISKRSLDFRDRWIMRCNRQNLWPFEEGQASLQENLVYPDIFEDMLAKTNEVSNVDPYAHASLLSVLPLLRESGATVVTIFSEDVTHVLCNLHQQGPLKISLSVATPVDFEDPIRGAQVLKRLRLSSDYPENCPDLVSPQWVRQEVWDKHGAA